MAVLKRIIRINECALIWNCLSMGVPKNTHNIHVCFQGEIRKYQYYFAEKGLIQGPVVQSIVSLTNSLMINSFTVVAIKGIFKYTDIFAEKI